MANDEPVEVEIPLAGGVKTRTNPHTIDAGDFRDLVNVRFGKDSLIEKRFGYTAYPKAAVYDGYPDPGHSVDTAKGLGTLDEELLLFGGRQATDVTAPPVSCFSWDVAEQKWSDRGFTPNAMPDTFGLLFSQSTIYSADICITGNLIFVAAETDFQNGGVIGVWVAVFDKTTHAIVRGPERVFNDDTQRQMSPRFVVRDDGAVLLFMFEQPNEMFVFLANAAGNWIFGVGGSSTAHLATNVALVGPNARPVFDAVAIQNDGTRYEVNIVYASTAVDLKALTIDATLATTASITTAETGSLVYGIALDSRTSPSGKLWICYTRATAGSPVAKYMTYVPRTLTGVVGPVTLTTDAGSGAALQHFCRVGVVMSPIDDTRAVAFFSFDGPYGSATNNICYMAGFCITAAGTAYDTKVWPGGCAQRISLASRPFVVEKRVYFYGCPRDIGTRSHTMLVDSGIYLQNDGIFHFGSIVLNQDLTARPVSSHAMRLGGSSSGAGTTASIPSDTAYFERVPAVINLGTNIYASLCAVYKEAFGNGYTISLAQDDLNSRFSMRGTKYGREFFVTPGGRYDGQMIYELGWLATPPAPTLSNAAGSGTTGVVSVVVVWKFVDIHGNIHRSAPSPASSISLTNKGTFDVNYPFIGSLTMYPFMRAEIYMTEPNGIVYYLADADHYAGALGGQSPYHLTITVTAAVDTTHPILYTQGQTGSIGGRLPNFGPGSLKALTKWKNRLWGIDDRGIIRYTNEHVDGEEPMWHDLLTETVDDEVLTALGATENGLAIFSAVGTWLLFGDGPADNGQGASFSLQRVPTSVGCTDQNTVIQFGSGLVFGDGDLYCLNRGMVVTDLGAPVHDYYAAYPNAVGAAHISHSAEVRIELQSTDGTKGIAVVWDEIRNAWLTHDRHDDDGGTDTTPAVGCTYWNGSYVWATAAGRVYVETPFTGWLDGATFINDTVTLPFIKDRNLQSGHRMTHVALLGEWFSKHRLIIDFQHDYVDAWVEEEDFEEPDMAAIEAGTFQYQFEIQMKTQKAQATSMRIRSQKPKVGSFGTGQGASWTSVLAQLSPMYGGAGKLLPPAQRR